MSRRLREEDMKESLHSVLSESQKMELNKIFDDANDSNLLKHQTQELQGQLQAAYKRIKILNESATEQRDKIFRLEKLVPTKQLEFEF
tara:strand:+ start:36 stop:299 length:264 start_codon:yes stop_codon:yes gene_type:complete